MDMGSLLEKLCAKTEDSEHFLTSITLSVPNILLILNIPVCM